MDVHVFRRFCDALTPMLLGARLEKIQSPLENVYVFTFYGGAGKKHLVFKVGRKDAFCYLAKERPTADAPPSAIVMRWRKYCSGRRIASCAVDWVGRRICLLFHTHNPDSLQPSLQTWLILDLREGIELVLDKSPSLDFAEKEISWPNPIYINDACDNWRQWPVLSPSLRRTISTLHPLDAQALLQDLEVGGGDLYVYEQDSPSSLDDKIGNSMQISAWPLLLADNVHEKVYEDPIQATSYVGDTLVLGVGAEKIRHKANLPHKREVSRLEKLLEKLSEDENRLIQMSKAQEIALILQGIIWQYPAKVKEKKIVTDNPEHPIITLDPKLSVRENMQALFHKAGRGRRGLEYLQIRREQLQEQLHVAKQKAEFGSASAPVILKSSKKNNLTKQPLGTWPKGIQAFKSSDGLIILRGKDAKGNGAVLRAAAAKDIWLHVEGGPGSHCVIRRQFSGQEIPERTLQEAANLAAIKSWQKDSPTAQILCAEVRHVKPMRGAALGTVRIDKVFLSFNVQIDNNIEEKLCT